MTYSYWNSKVLYSMKYCNGFLYWKWLQLLNIYSFNVIYHKVYCVCCCLRINLRYYSHVNFISLIFYASQGILTVSIWRFPCTRLLFLSVVDCLPTEFVLLFSTFSKDICVNEWNELDWNSNTAPLFIFPISITPYFKSYIWFNCIASSSQ